MLGTVVMTWQDGPLSKNTPLGSVHCKDNTVDQFTLHVRCVMTDGISTKVKPQAACSECHSSP